MQNYDEIRIENLECFAYHGVKPEENEQGQFFYINAVLYTEIRKVAAEDDLNQTTNYSKVAKYINELMTRETYQLIETVAEKIALSILLEFPLVQKLDLEVRKPDAPINLNFTSISVKITRGWQRVYIATGSNLGDSEQLINTAIGQIKGHPQIRDVRASSLINSTPYGVTDQPDFVNGAVTFHTLLTPYELLEFLQGLEIAAGRGRDNNKGFAVEELQSNFLSSNKSVRWGARTLDLDILLYEDILIDEADLVIPHSDMHNRDFVLTPLISLNRHLKHPVLNRSMKQLLDDLTERYAVT
ncbi:MAG: dihydroneopterin aldolase [Lachnospiraceae bacterium]|nr:dihydroneopterin aldolase [Lachnospiraceae bacterium]